MIVLYVNVACLKRCSSCAEIDGDCLFGYRNCPEQAGFGCAGIEVVNLPTIQVEDIESYERECTVVIASIGPYEFSGHKAHVRLEGEMGGLPANRVGPHSSNRSPSDKAIEIGYRGRLDPWRGKKDMEQRPPRP